MAAPFLTGFTLSLSLIVAIGAQNAFVLRQGLRREHLGVVVAVCALLDVLLMAAGVFGLGALVGASPRVLDAITLAGAAVLVFYGVQALRRALAPGHLLAGPGVAGMPRARALREVLAISLLNPHVYLDTVVLVGAVGMARNDPDFFPLFVGNYVLGGGGFDSRLMREVRDKRGYAYSAYSYFMPMAEAGPFQLGLQTKLEQTDDALKVAQATLRQFIADGPSEAELDQAKSNLTGGFPLRIDSNRKILDYLAVIGFYRLPLDYLDTWVAKVDAVDVAAVKQAFARRIDPDKLVTVVVGAGSAR